jgi:hypothetical protein
MSSIPFAIAKISVAARDIRSRLASSSLQNSPCNCMRRARVRVWMSASSARELSGGIPDVKDEMFVGEVVKLGERGVVAMNLSTARSIIRKSCKKPKGASASLAVPFDVIRSSLQDAIIYMRDVPNSEPRTTIPLTLSNNEASLVFLVCPESRRTSATVSVSSGT